jgi:hypothetical protein
MKIALLAVLLFGFVHLESKMILATGISLLPFCLFQEFRLLVQMPAVSIIRKANGCINSLVSS